MDGMVAVWEFRIAEGPTELFLEFYEAMGSIRVTGSVALWKRLEQRSTLRSFGLESARWVHRRRWLPKPATNLFPILTFADANCGPFGFRLKPGQHAFSWLVADCLIGRVSLRSAISSCRIELNEHEMVRKFIDRNQMLFSEWLQHRFAKRNGGERGNGFTVC
jgi:hypothetical protein